ncbi:hypothetical protein QR721_00925 [Aciduricibacillus chroicocephali]|uniref:CARD domain-containing protein n=1 Tax=Aciduricibacillus chroicocephali TaxID=3054939 RepID=A0ABY9KVE4_9BACI|nr:hypothetical protein QR721_00925 [Bacillaceae bacterium 44XB]
MLGLLVNETEQKELEYILKRELEELLLDLEDPRIDNLVKESMKERYKGIFQLLRRVASSDECLKYMPRKQQSK